MKIIALLTDFGTQDIYVGVMKGVIWSICPDAQIVDLTHEIPPQDVTAGALALWGAFKFFPQGTVFCAVVDPGVGTARRAIVIQTREHFFVGPDNGLLWWAVSESEIVKCAELRNRAYFLPSVSQTFHGRDIFAPVSAHIAKGVSLEEFGPDLEVSKLVELPPLKAELSERTIQAKVIYIDRFGNAITDLRYEDFVKWMSGQRAWTATIGGVRFNSLNSSYAEVPTGKPLLLFNSYGLLEVAVNQGNAAEQIGIRKGEVLEIRAEGKDEK